MLREFWDSLSDLEKLSFRQSAQIGPGMLKKYLRPEPRLRVKPSNERFDAMLAAANDIRPGCISREQLAAYFYAASGRTGTGKPKAA